MKKIRPYNPKTPVSTRGSHNHKRTLEEYARSEKELIDKGILGAEESDRLRNGCYTVGIIFIVILGAITIWSEL